MKLTRIRNMGRYKFEGNGYNVKSGLTLNRGQTVHYYLYRQNRIFISDIDFYSDKWQLIKTI